MFCEVYLLDVPYHLDRPFDYECRDGAVTGALVKVPFGKADKLRIGIVTKVKDSSDSEKIKPVHSSLDGRLRLTEEMCGLCLFLKEHTLCTFGEAVKSILPPGALSDKLNESFRKTVSLAKPREEIATALTLTGRAGVKSEGQRSILRYLLDIGSADAELVRALPGVTSANISALREKGLISVTESENIRNPYAAYAKERDTAEIVLSRAQTEAYHTIEGLYLEDKARCALLHGVTGSGKTKIILKAIDRCIADGKNVIMMVPEISLTPQTVSIFCKRYGERVAVIHSSLSAGERMDAWKRIKRERKTVIPRY